MIKDVNGRFKVVNEHRPRRTSSHDIAEQIQKQNRVRIANDISDWSLALDIAEKMEDPDRTKLVEIYRNMEIDGHVKGIVTTLKNKIKSKDFWLVDQDNNPNDDAKAIFESKWFSRYLDWSVESRFYGFSLIQLNDPVNGAFENMELFDRRFVLPDFGIIKESIHRFSHGDLSWSYKDDPNLKDWYIFIGEDKDLGLYNNIAPQVISKKHMLSALWQFVEIFGMPIRIGKTDIDDNAQKQNMINMLDQMGRAPYGVFGLDDDIELKESIKGDAAVFIDSIELSNKEISKGITGITGLFDEMSLVGSAEIQDSILDSLILSYTREIEYDINDDLIPRMQKKAGFGSDVFRWKADERLNTKDKVDAIAKLSSSFEISAEEATDATGIEMSEKVIEPIIPPTKEEQSPSVASSVKALYDTFDLK